MLLNELKTLLNKGHSLGFYECGDEVLNWINSQDETDVKKFRSELVKFILSLRPENLRL